MPVDVFVCENDDIDWTTEARKVIIKTESWKVLKIDSFLSLFT